MSKVDYAFWFGLVSCVSVVVTWIVSFCRNRVNLSVSYPMATFVSNYVIMLNISFANFSDRNALIRSIEAKQGTISVKFAELPEKVFSHETRSGGTITSHSNTYSQALPMTVFGHSTSSGYFIAHDPEAKKIDFGKPVTIRILVNKHHLLETKTLSLEKMSTFLK